MTTLTGDQEGDDRRFLRIERNIRRFEDERQEPREERRRKRRRLEQDERRDDERRDRDDEPRDHRMMSEDKSSFQIPML